LPRHIQTTSNEGTHHHTLTASVLFHETKNIEKLLNTMESFKNPFIKESKKLFNLVSKVLVPEKVQEGLVGQSDIGQKFNSLIRLPKIVSSQGGSIYGRP